MFKLIARHPHKVIWSVLPLLLGLSILGFNKTIDLQFHDTYFVISWLHIGALLSITFSILGLVYWWFRNTQLIQWMTIVHVITTLIFALLFFALLVFSKYFMLRSILVASKVAYIVVFSLGLFILGQIAFVFNIVFSKMSRQ